MATFNNLESKQSMAHQPTLETKLVELKKLQDKIVKLWNGLPTNKKIKMDNDIKKINEQMDKVNKKMEARRNSARQKEIDAAMADAEKLNVKSDKVLKFYGSLLSTLNSVEELGETNKNL